MLKKFLTIIVAVCAVSFMVPAQAGVADALANICAIVKANDKSELRKKMKSVRSDYSMQLRDYYNGISCDGESLIRLAILNNAVDAGTLLVKKMPKKELRKPEKDGKTLQAWITEQGLADNEISKEVVDRI